MQDEIIVSMFMKRDEQAIAETALKYNSFMLKIACNILGNIEDSKEAVNDTYLKLWKSIPPHSPSNLGTYLGKLVRRASIDILRFQTCAKRGGSEYDLSLDELGECIGFYNTTEQEINMHLLANAIETYLNTIPINARITFIGRYYFSDSLRDITRYSGLSEPKVSALLCRTRKGLKQYLKNEGFL